MTAAPLLLQILRRPETSKSLDLADWDLLLRQARRANLLATLHALLEERGHIEQVPSRPREHLGWAHAIAERHAQAVDWEIAQIRKALAKANVPLILLKGAAYVAARLPPARGRLFSDVDILVPKGSLDVVEAALTLHGWATTHHDEYDQRYYRTWMHELPPMQHVKRMTVIDVHHAILPETAALRPDPEKLRTAAQSLASHADVKVLAPIDMVLHSAAHLFHEGELDNGLRDLVDIHCLLAHFGGLPSFWPDLVRRAKELELTRPLFYALRYTERMLHAAIPPDAMEAAGSGRPHRQILALMDQLYTRAFLPNHPSCRDRLAGMSRRMLYLRANWLRMPPLLLARHLFHKAFISPDLA
ncbi:hypothetical protein D3870_14585 [Noviherbaspirillum cavernae]|uniref:Nucleotidyltransferase family protein n=1 Tax=Noviherbaspirillum cavernae TaxID=2320862 RepID=A0A418X3M7_9BURK|nr:nucleotidyltransferase family protein [Noviherbaspirillum cavernae]RJG07059.1 hypothetical protein D3870_14585 [Noviherbaspirillum cavernae]